MGFQNVMLVNRTSEPYECMFDGQVIRLEANETIPVPLNVARNVVAQSYQSLGLTDGVPHGYRLGIRGETDCSPSGKPQKRTELLDRSSMEKLQHSKPQILTKDGLTPVTGEVGSSPVSTPVTQAMVREASTGKRSHKKKQSLTAKTLEFDNPPPRHGGGTGHGSAISVNT